MRLHVCVSSSSQRGHWATKVSWHSSKNSLMKRVKVTHQIKVRVCVPGCLGERHRPPTPKGDLIAEYISHPGENERFTVTGRPRSSEEPWAGINLHNPARLFVKEQMDPQLFALGFMCGLDCVVQGAPLVTSREPVCFSRTSRESLPVVFFFLLRSGTI